MIMIDTHAHLFTEEFDQDRKEMMQRAFEKEVTRIYLPNIDHSTIAPMLKMEEEFPGKAFPMIGLHPESVKADFEEELKVVRDWLTGHTFAAIGEIGLDFYWDTTFKTQQIAAFSRQIEWALEYKLPVVIHARNSMRECLDTVRSRQDGSLKGIFHCFSGTIEEAQEVVDLGFLMGIGGIITFKNTNLREIVEQVDLKHLVLETDSPYLAPVPHRGKRNESSYIPLIAEKIAEVKKISVKQVAEVTTKNALEVYKM